MLDCTTKKKSSRTAKKIEHTQAIWCHIIKPEWRNVRVNFYNMSVKYYCCWNSTSPKIAINGRKKNGMSFHNVKDPLKTT